MEMEEKIKILERRIQEIEAKVFPESLALTDAVKAFMRGDEGPLRLFYQNEQKGERP